jgi:hypothetical protein
MINDARKAGKTIIVLSDGRVVDQDQILKALCKPRGLNQIQEESPQKVELPSIEKPIEDNEPYFIT